MIWAGGLYFEIYPWQKLSEYKVSGKLADERFMKMSQWYDGEQRRKKDILLNLALIVPPMTPYRFFRGEISLMVVMVLDPNRLIRW